MFWFGSVWSLRITQKFVQENYIKSEVKCEIWGPGFPSLEPTLHQNGLGWLVSTLRMFTERLPRCTLFSKQGIAGRWFEVASQVHNKIV